MCVYLRVKIPADNRLQGITRNFSFGKLEINVLGNFNTFNHLNNAMIQNKLRYLGDVLSTSSSGKQFVLCK